MLYGAGVTSAGGFACTPGSGLSVVVAPGSILNTAAIDDTAYGSLAAVSSLTTRQYIMRDPTTLTVPGTGATYTVYALAVRADTGAAVLPFYNASSPSQALAGPGNNGQAQPSVRQDVVGVGLGTSVPNGAIGLWTITVPGGATSITQAMIAQMAGAPFQRTIPQLAPLYRYPDAPLPVPVSFTSPGSFSMTVPAGVYQVEIEAYGAGGSGATASSNGDGGGGGGGAASALIVASVNPGDTISGSLGTAGGGATGFSGNGNAGTATTVTIGQQTITLGGGAGGTKSTGNGQGGPGGQGGTVSSSGTNSALQYTPYQGGWGGDGTGAISGQETGQGGFGGATKAGGGGRGGTTGGTTSGAWGTGSGGGYTANGTGGSIGSPAFVVIRPRR